MFSFSEAQLQIIRDLKAARLYPDAYRKIAEWSSGQDGVDERSVLWFCGAADINAGQGPFSTLIRSYTSYQHQFRFGTGLSPAQLQSASNLIAESVLTQVLGANAVPNLGGLGSIDAGVIAGLYSDPALWSGTFLFLMFRDANPFQSYIIQDEPGDPYDFLAFVKAASEATGDATIFTSGSAFYHALASSFQGISGASALAQRLFAHDPGPIIQTFAAALASGNTLLNGAYDDRVSIASLVTANSIKLGRVDAGDSLVGGSGYDLMLGAEGNDILQGLGGDDVLDGGAGSDLLFGGGEDDDLFGGAAPDQLLGDAGDDYLNGGAGGDFLTGGAGNDTFVLSREGGLDTILDPQAGDRIRYEGDLVSGRAQNLDNGIYKLGNYVFMRQGSDLAFFPKGGSGPAALIKNFFPPDYDGGTDVTLIGITVPKDSREPDDLGIPGDNAKTSPIALDLNGDGLKYIPYTLSGNAAHFDIDNDGYAEGMEWLDRNDGFLVRDTNGNGRIDNQAEMFGDDGGTTAYQKLALLDTNHDGQVSAADTGFSNLRIWQDANGNGRTDAGELKTLDSLQIVSLSLQLTAATSLNGHAVAGTSSFTRATGSVGVAADILFDVRQSDSVYVGPDTAISPPVDLSTLFLPLSRGYGTLPALHYAMGRDPVLKAMIADLTALDLSRMNEVYDRVTSILLQWGDAAAIAPTGSANDRNAAKLAVLQRFVDGNTSQINVDQAFGTLLDNMIAKLLVQGPLHKVFSGASYDFATDTIVLGQGIDAILAQARLFVPSDVVDKSIYWTEILRILGQSFSDALPKTEAAAGFSLAYPSRILGTAGNDILTGYNGGRYQGFGGDDLFHAGPGTFVYNIGDGADTILKNPLAWPDQKASLYFGPGISFGALTFQVTGARLVIGVPGGGSITFADSAFLESMRFADGTVKTATQINFAIYGGVGTGGDDLLHGDASANLMTGLAGSDHIYGAAGNDTLDGGSGDDWLQGNQGADIIDGGAGIDTVAYGASISDGGTSSATTGVIIDLRAPVQRGGDAEGDVLRNVENVTGTDYDDFFAGDANPNFFEGWTGIDTVSYASSPAAVAVDMTRYYSPQSGGDAEGDVLNNLDRLIGSNYDDRLTADYTDILDGAGGNDTLIAGRGREMLTGGSGTDTFIVMKGSGFTTTIVDLNYLGGEMVVLGGFGDAGKYANLLFSQSGANTIITLPGGQSITLLNVDRTRLAAANFADAFMLGTAGNDVLGGGAGNDVLIAYGGNDRLDGGAGIDQLDGGAGDDIYFVDTIADRVVEAANAGSDAVYASASFALGGSSVETLSTIDHAATIAITLTGNGFDQTIIGNAGANLLHGGGGSDLLVGLGGNDVYYVDAAAARVNAGGGTDMIYVSVSYVLAAGQEIETLSAGDYAATTALSLTGNGFGQKIVGNAGANVLQGGGGADVLVGLGGNDVYYVDVASVQIQESVGGGADTVYTSVSYALTSGMEIEILSANSYGATTAINLTGNGLANRLYGNAGSNILIGGGGADIMAGMGGNDIYYVDAASVQIVENAGAGSDTVYASISYALTAGAEVETVSTNSYGATTAINLSGNAFNQTLIGNAGANTLQGGGGTDVLIGLGGNDVYYVDVAATQVSEAAGGGADTVYAGVSYALAAGSEVETLSANNYAATTAIGLTGNAFANTIFGNAGNNFIDGKGGNDQLVGFGGADTFAFTAALGAGNIDVVYNFLHGTDKIGLDDAVFTAIGGLGALNANAFFAGAGAHDLDDRIIYNAATGQLFYDADGNGANATAVQFASLATGLTLTASDFVVI